MRHLVKAILRTGLESGVALVRTCRDPRAHADDSVAAVHTGAVDKAEGASADDADLLPFVAVVQDPGGLTYHVQASRAFGGSGPVMIGGRDGLATHGPLGLLNRILAKTSKPQQGEFVSVLAYRDDPSGPTTVAQSAHPRAREARDRAQAIIQAIEQGTFVPE